MAITNNTTFNRSNQGGTAVGYHSRILFTYAPTNAYPEITGDTPWIYDNGDGLGYLVNSIGGTQGSYILPPYYWRPGKIIRIKGAFVVEGQFDEGGLPVKSQYLRMNFLISEFDVDGQNISNTTIASTNNNNNHIWLQDSLVAVSKGPTPVEYQFTVGCESVDLGTSQIKFEGQGYFSYGVEPDKTTGLFYSPIWNSSSPTSVSTSTYYTKRSGITYNIYSSAVNGSTYFYPSSVKVRYITIEELA